MAPQEQVLEGIAISPGIAIGRAFICSRFGLAAAEQREIAVDEVEAEVERFKRAVDVSREQLEVIRRQVAEAIDEQHADIYAAQMVFLDDVELVDVTIDAIRSENKNAEFLFTRRVQEFVKLLSKFEDELFRARDSDLLDIANRVVSNLAHDQPAGLGVFGPDTVLVAHDLAPSQTAVLVKEHVVAFVMERGGPTSHTAIMAKALEIPAVVAMEDVTQSIENGAPIIVDGLTGKVVLYPSAETFAAYNRKQRDFLEFERELDLVREQPAETLDGYSVTIRANIEFPEEISHIAMHGARGIGLFRTEFVYINRQTPPTEEEQCELYRQVATQVFPDTVVFRTLDLGGDKFFSSFSRSHELNPFMGQRAIRLCLKHPEIFRQQLRAIVKASHLGNAQILIPMISGVEEFRQVREHLESVKVELDAEGIPFDRNLEVGAMIEVPSAAVVADLLARECDFFSIGTNDLIQYSLAVDRGNQQVAYLYEPLHPAILRLLRSIVSAGEDAGIRVCVCGEMAADPMMAIVLLGMGVHELSMSAVSVPPVKRLIRSIRLSEAKGLVEDLLGEETIEGVKEVVRDCFQSLVREQRIPRSQVFSTAVDLGV